MYSVLFDKKIIFFFFSKKINLNLAVVCIDLCCASVCTREMKADQKDQILKEFIFLSEGPTSFIISDLSYF